MAGEDHRYAVDIRVFVSVIVIAMAVSFGVGVGLGPTAHTPASAPKAQELPSVTSVEMNEAEIALAALAAADDGELHEPAGQVNVIARRDCLSQHQKKKIGL
mmetsp:Transcript_16239/g.33194  ORF Transcript_16239/g.33194 Transcript_16239/m.33194 type:complete len:102 (+) Transcript_16239:169-474(+)